MIEKGRHAKPNKIIREERFSYFCKDKIEDEEHFLIACPMYLKKRKQLDSSCRINCNNYDYLNNEQKFVFIMTNENISIVNTLGNFIIESLTVREKIIDYFFT